MMPTVKSMNSTPVLQAQEESFSRDFETIKTPLPSDILCGKNKICIKHEGSKSFRRIIESYTLKYQQATSRQAKMDITKEIFDRLQTRRFLKYNEETDMWETLHPLAVRDKIGHALRFSNRKGASAIRKQVRRSTSDISHLSRTMNGIVGSSSSNGLGSMNMGMSSSSSADSGVRRNSANSINMPLSQQGVNALRHSTGSMPQLTDFNLLEQMTAAGFGQNGLGNFNTSIGNNNNNPEFQLMQPSLPPLGPTFNTNVWNTAAAKQGMATQATAVAKNLIGNQVNMQPNQNDLSWMLQMPLMELDAEGHQQQVAAATAFPNHQASANF